MNLVGDTKSLNLVGDPKSLNLVGDTTCKSLNLVGDPKSLNLGLLTLCAAPPHTHTLIRVRTRRNQVEVKLR